MAAVLKVDDGLTNVSFLDAAGLYLARDGWRQRVAAENEAGDEYEDVVEVIKLKWMQTSDDDRDTIMHNLNRLDAKARRYWRLRQIVDAVWLEVRSHSETSSRFARIKSLELTQLDVRHWRADQYVDAVLTIVREGAFTAISPASNSYTTIASNVVLENEIDPGAGTSNQYKIDVSDVPGDALALPILDMENSGGMGNIIIALRAKEDEDDIDNFQSHLNAANFSPATHLTADASAAEGQKWERTVTGTSSSTVGAPLPYALAYYTGTYLVYAVAKASASDIFTIQVGHYNSASPSPMQNAQAAMPVPLTSDYALVYLGTIMLPPAGEYGVLADPPAYYINLKMAWSGASSSTLSVRGAFLVPTDDGVFGLAPASSPTRRFIDSRIERSIPYYMNAAVKTTLPNLDAPRGRFLKLKPGHYNQLLFYGADANGYFLPSITFEMDFHIIPRWLGIRGDT